MKEIREQRKAMGKEWEGLRGNEERHDEGLLMSQAHETFEF